MVRTHTRILVVITALVGSGAVLADDAPAATARGLAGEILFTPSSSRSGVSGQDFALSVTRSEVDLAGPLGTGAFEWGAGRLALPLSRQTVQLDSRRILSSQALAIEWQHAINAGNMVALSASRGDSLYNDPELPASSGSAASVRWSTLVGGASRVTGRFYLGDEETRDRGSVSSARRYLGLELEGRYSLWRDHTPFASLAWQRSDYENLDVTAITGASTPRRENSSRIATGWNWQVGPNWDVRAEARYRLRDDAADPSDTDRTQLYFSSRYGFR
jgi:hypothetical protein